VPAMPDLHVGPARLSGQQLPAAAGWATHPVQTAVWRLRTAQQPPLPGCVLRATSVSWTGRAGWRQSGFLAVTALNSQPLSLCDRSCDLLCSLKVYI
jgi:hypothetical protein